MKCIKSLILLSFCLVSAVEANDLLKGDRTIGWGMEYKFGGNDNGFDMFSFSQTGHDYDSITQKYYYSDAVKLHKMSCVPNETDSEGQCSIGWVTPVIYILALPISFNLYKEMFNVE